MKVQNPINHRECSMTNNDTDSKEGLEKLSSQHFLWSLWKHKTFDNEGSYNCNPPLGYCGPEISILCKSRIVIDVTIMIVYGDHSWFTAIIHLYLVTEIISKLNSFCWLSLFDIYYISSDE